MNLDRERKLQDLLAALLDEPEAERLSAARRLAAGDDDILAALTALLAALPAADRFLERPLTIAPDAFAAVSESTAERDSGAAQIGRILGEFELLEYLGEGGMGVVYRARQRSPARDVAVKVMRWLDLSSDARSNTPHSARRRFDAETRALARMRHPGIALVLASGVDETTKVAWIAMEFVVGGRPLTQYVRDERLPLPARLALMEAICDAVHHGHQKGVIHRDLKPSNVLVDVEGRAKLIDFGIARVFDADQPPLTAAITRTPIGTLPYMSPEHCTLDASDVRSDVYSLGVMLYELVTGHLPHSFDGVSLETALRRIRTEPVPPPRRHDRTLPADLETIIRTAVEKDPARRYQSAAALAADLRRFAEHRPIEARAARWPHHVTLFARRHLSLVVAGLVILATLLVATLVSVRFAVHARGELAERLRAEREAASERDTAQRYGYNGSIAAAAAALDHHENGRMDGFLDVTPTALRGWEWHYLKRQAQASQATFTLHEGRVFAVAWHPERELVASAGMDRTVRLWAPDGTASAPPVALPEMVYALDFNEDGTLLAVCMSNAPATIFRVVAAPDGDRLVPTGERYPLPRDGASWIEFSPSGRTLVVAGAQGAVLYSRPGDPAPEDGAPFARVDAKSLIACARFSPDGDHLALIRDGTLEIHRLVDDDVPATVEPTGWTCPALPPGRVLTVAWSPDGTRLASADRDGGVHLIDLATGRSEARADLAPDHVRRLEWTPDGRALVAALGDKNLAVLDPATLATRQLLPGHSDVVSALHVAADGRRIVSGSFDRTARVWHLADGSVDALAVGEWWKPDVRGLSYAPDGSVLAIANDRGHLRLVDAVSWQTLKERLEPTTGISALLFSADGAALIVARDDGTVEFLRRDLTTAAAPIPSGAARVTAIARDAVGTRLITAGGDRSLRVWTIFGDHHGERLAILGPAASEFSCVAVGADGTTIVGGTLGGEVIAWNAATLDERWRRTDHQDSVLAITVDPFTGTIVTGGRDQRIVARDPDTGTPRAVCEGHGQRPMALALTPDGRRLVSMSRFPDVRVWEWSGGSNPPIGAELLTLRAPELGALRALAIHPHGHEITVGGAGMVTRWSTQRVRPVNRRD